LGRSYRLSSYDAAYLDLALHESLPLATSDVRLQTAMVQLGISLFDPAFISRS
jgi:predicted nucleic acid-binding protein